MLKNLMARFGHGAAKVDLILNRNQFTLGDLVEGTLVIYGGAVEQRINKIEVRLMVTVQMHERHMTYPVTSIPFYQSFTIYPGERKEFPFQYTLPNNLPISGNHVTYFFKTELDIAGAIDQNDYDYIQILPPHALQQVLFALDQLGFRETHDSRRFDGHVQEFKFFPTSYYSGQVKELEFAAFLLPDGVRLLLELEVYSFGHLHELKREVFISNDQIQSVSELVIHLRQIIDEMIQQPHMTYPPNEYSHPHPYYGPEYHGYGHYPEHHRPGSGWAGAIGGFLAGAVGGMLLSEMLDDDDGNHHHHHNYHDHHNYNNHDGGLLDDLFGNNDDDGFGNGDDWL